ncbi:hypothetical protein ACXR2U_14000 [Jatrophihabitans sp. YIM 134969]
MSPWRTLVPALAALAVTAAGVVSAGTAGADPATGAAVSSAWDWIEAQGGTGTSVVSTSTIRPTKTYASTATGAVSGTFTVAGITAPPVVNPASIAVDRPTSVPSTYAKPVSGHLTVASTPGRFIVQAYKDTSSGRVQVPLQAPVDVDGDFTIDLGAVSSPPKGTWALGLLDATNAYAPYGTAWPAAPVYDGWIVRALVVTDTSYVVGEQPARTDGTFAFASSAPGVKCFQLVAAASGAVLAEYAPDSGLVRSYAGGTTASSYDQALAVTTALALGEDSSALTAGLIAMQRTGGGFVDVVDVRNPAGRAGTQWTGNSAVAAWALLRRVQTMSTADADYAATRQAAVRATTFLKAQRRSDGLLDAGQSGDGSPSPTWVSTEHNLDAWHALRLAGVVLGDTAATTAANTLATAIVAKLWDASAGHFRRGLSSDGPDDTDALDVSSWGTVFLRAIGRSDLAAQSLAHTAAFASVDDGHSGYRSYHPQPVFPDAPDNVWVEGSAGVALAQTRSGSPSAAAATLSDLLPLQRPDGSFPYATTADDATSMTTQSAVAAATWFVLASLAPTGSSIWD